LLFKHLRIEVHEEKKEIWLNDILTHQKEPKKEKESTEHTEEEKKSKPPFVWRDFDWNHDGLLQSREIDSLVQVLRDDPSAMSDKEESESAHPPIRDRILFLADLMNER
jgi:hypothetical protein